MSQSCIDKAAIAEAAIAEGARFETLTKLTSTIKAMGVLRISFLRLS